MIRDTDTVMRMLKRVPTCASARSKCMSKPHRLMCCVCILYMRSFDRNTSLPPYISNVENSIPNGSLELFTFHITSTSLHSTVHYMTWLYMPAWRIWQRLKQLIVFPLALFIALYRSASYQFLFTYMLWIATTVFYIMYYLTHVDTRVVITFRRHYSSKTFKSRPYIPEHRAALVMGKFSVMSVLKLCCGFSQSRKLVTKPVFMRLCSN